MSFVQQYGNPQGQFVNYYDYVTPSASYGMGATQAQQKSAASLIDQGGTISNAPVDIGAINSGGFDLFDVGKKALDFGGLDLVEAGRQGLNYAGNLLGFEGISSLPAHKAALIAKPGTGAAAGTTGGFFSGVTNSINSFGASNFGMSASGAGSLSGAIGGGLTGAGIGYAVGSLNPWAKNQKNSQIGGTVGGTIGGVVGSIVPGIGTFIGSAIGSVLGSAIGGLFGNKGNNWSVFGFNSGDGLINDGTKNHFSAKKMSGEVGQVMYEQFGGYLETLQRKFDLNFDGLDWYGGFNRKYGGGYFIKGLDGRNINFNPEDAASLNEGFATAAIEGLQRKGIDDEELFEEIRSFDYNKYQQQAIQQLQAETLAKQGRSLQGIPLIASRKASPAPTGMDGFIANTNISSGTPKTNNQQIAFV